MWRELFFIFSSALVGPAVGVSLFLMSSSIGQIIRRSDLCAQSTMGQGGHPPGGVAELRLLAKAIRQALSASFSVTLP